MAPDAEEVAERTPLLPPKRLKLPRQTSTLPEVHAPETIILVLAVTTFLVMTGDFMIRVPQARIFEDIICNHFYDKSVGPDLIALPLGIDESMCKGDEVQSELAMLMGILDMLSNVPGVLVAIPFGLLADRIGRKRVFFLGMTGITCAQIWILMVCWFWRSFPLKLVLASPIFMFIGGGDKVVTSIIFALASDVSTDRTRANHFFLIGCASMAPELVAPSIASVLMKRSPWIPAICGTSMLGIGASCFIFLPETLHLHPVNGTTTPTDSESDSIASLERSRIDDASLRARCVSFAKSQWEKFHAVTEVLHSMPVLALLSTFIPASVTMTSLNLVVRYISKRYSWTLANAGFLMSLRAGIGIVVLLVILPGISYLLTKKPNAESPFHRFAFGLTDHAKDLVLARASLFFLVGGLTLLAVAPTIGAAIAALVIFTMGMGYLSLCRSLITNMVDQKHVARLYSMIGVLETIGVVGGSPALAALYAAGIKRARQSHAAIWQGLPFVALAAMIAACGVGLWCIRSDMRKTRAGIYEDVQEDVQGDVHDDGDVDNRD